MKRRAFITLIGGAAAAWSLAARAQQSAKPVIGYMHATAQPNSDLFAAFKEGLSQTGYVDGRNVIIEFRSAEGQYDRLPAIAAEFVRRQVNVIVAGTPVAALAAKRATSSIPIVFAVGSDPIRDGLVERWSCCTLELWHLVRCGMASRRWSLRTIGQMGVGRAER